jgi:uncharacterized phiE125 gp8 family phage protein
MPIQLLAGPSVEPVSLAEAKAHLRVDIADDDALIAALIVTARQCAETITRRALVTQQWLLATDRFPSPMAGRLTEYWLGQQWGLAGMGGVSQFPVTDRTGYGFLLPLCPLQSVDSIQYTDTGGGISTMAVTDYKVDSVSEPARILPAYGKAWPTTRQEINAVQITFTAGYGLAAAVPQGIKAWMLLRIGSMYQHREEQALLERATLSPQPFVDRLLDPFRVMTFS